MIIIIVLTLFLVSTVTAQDHGNRLNVDGDDFGEIEKINFYTKRVPVNLVGTEERFITYEIVSKGKSEYSVSDFFSISKKYNLLSFTEKGAGVEGVSLKITMPNNLVLEFNNETAPLSLAHLKVDYLKIKSEAGILRLVNIGGDAVDISCTACELNMESTEATISSVNKYGHTHIDVEALKLFNNLEHPIIASTDTGDITLKLPKDITTTIKTRAKRIQVDDVFSPELNEEGKYTYVRILGDKDYGNNKTQPTRNMVILSSNQGEIHILKR